MSDRRKFYDEHHRKPRSKGGTNEKRNISRVPRKIHECWHILFSNLDPQEIADIINAVWLDPDYKFIVRKRQGR